MTVAKNSKMELDFVTKTLQDKERTKNTSDASYEKNKRNLENKERDVATIKVRLVFIVYDDSANKKKLIFISG